MLKFWLILSMNRGFKIFLAVLCLYPAFLEAQVFETPENEGNPFQNSLNSSFQIDFGLNAVSDQITFKLARDFYTGQFLDEALILQNEKRLNNMNRLGFESSGGLTFYAKPKYVNPEKSKQSFLFLGTESILGAKYTDEAWSLLMRGNGPYAGRSMALGETGFRNTGWVELSFGEKIRNAGKSSVFQWATGVFLLHNNQQLHLQEATLFTQTDGELISVSAMGSRESQHSPGIGLKGDFSYGIQFENSQAFKFYLHDFGISFLGRDEYTLDTSFEFTGFYIADPSDFVSNDRWEDLTDSLINGLKGKKTASSPMALPAKAGVQYFYNLNKNHGLSVEISYRYLSFAQPLFTAAHHALIRNAVSVKSTVGYGGWGGFQWNESVTFHSKKASLLLEFGGMQSMSSEKMPLQFSGRTGIFIRI